MSDTDLELLSRYTRSRAEDAFSEIVQRHLDLVHSAALRQVRSSQLAEEVAQSTFIKLARHAHRLAPDTVLTAWLYQVTRREAIDVVRREGRRQLRDQIAVEMNAMNATADDWTQIEPLLDDAMHALDDTDRTAVLLRFFENKSLREVGESLGTTDDTARKRVNRAIEHLREFFAKRGVTVGASGLVVVISTNAVQAAPVGLSATITAAAATVVKIVGAPSILNTLLSLTAKAKLITVGIAALATLVVVMVGLRLHNESSAINLGVIELVPNVPKHVKVGDADWTFTETRDASGKQKIFAASPKHTVTLQDKANSSDPLYPKIGDRVQTIYDLSEIRSGPDGGTMYLGDKLVRFKLKPGAK